MKKVFVELEELHVKYFKEPAGTKVTFSTFERSSTCVPWCQVVMKVQTPSTSKSRFYKFDEDVNKKVVAKFEKMK